jgi:hypothetical protein
VSRSDHRNTGLPWVCTTAARPTNAARIGPADAEYATGMRYRRLRESPVARPLEDFLQSLSAVQPVASLVEELGEGIILWPYCKLSPERVRDREKLCNALAAFPSNLLVRNRRFALALLRYSLELFWGGRRIGKQAYDG